MQFQSQKKESEGKASICSFQELHVALQSRIASYSLSCPSQNMLSPTFPNIYLLGVHYVSGNFFPILLRHN